MDLERAKSALEQTTGLGRPSVEEVASLLRRRKPATLWLRDDGVTPNNPHLPVVLYRSPVALKPGRSAPSFDPAAAFETLFNANYWGGSWRNGMYDYEHWHAGTHEVLGIARGKLSAHIGGMKNGRLIELRTGDVIVLPAGTGHHRHTASKDLLVVGAYPEGSEYDEVRPEDDDYAASLGNIWKLPLPLRDPVYGDHGPLVDIWKRASTATH